jgi:uncharacterized protein YbjT (DUF2867 family)
MREMNVLTGAFGYTGRYIARRLLALGKEVRTLTAHPRLELSFADAVSVSPLAFDDPASRPVLFQAGWLAGPRRDPHAR